MNIALLGFGTVGSHFYKLCEGRTDLHVAAVLSRRPRPELTCTVTADYDEIVRDPSIDIVVEVMGGIEPAYSYLCAAMRAGKHVVTANKQLMCAHFEELTSLAKEKGVALRCTAAAGGGIPWLTSLSRASELDEIKAVEGILNGTTNYMLSAMTNSGADYAPALRKAQELGYAEADPTADVEGLDARRKIVLSADLAFGVNIREEDIPCVGISSITTSPSSTGKRGRRCSGSCPAATVRQAAVDTATAIRSPVKFAAVSAARASPTAPKSGRMAAPIIAGAASPPPTRACGAQTAREMSSDAASGGRSGTTSPWIFYGAP